MIPLRIVFCAGTNTDADADANPANVADSVADTFADAAADTVEAAEPVCAEGFMQPEFVTFAPFLSKFGHPLAE